MKNILIIVNAVKYNRGSEALARTTAQICKSKYEDSKITLVQAIDDYKDIKIEGIDFYEKKLNYTTNSITRYIVGILKRLKCPLLIINNLKYSKLKKLCKKQDEIIVVGGDNYDITYNMQEEANILNTYIRKNTKAKMILYDCTIDKNDITECLKKDFENFDIITVRESLSYENIKEYVKKDKLYIFPDPAFIMEAQEIELPDIFDKNMVVGINLSNLITKSTYGSKKSDVLKAYKNMIDYILENTEKNILLIPHVMNNSDLSTLKELYEHYKDNKRVYLMDNENLNAKQLKYLISKCELYIGARTHSTIAAYSTNVPTLVLGYSLKSKGIAKDIFGTYENYVLPVSNLNSDQYLIEGFKWLNENKNKIKKELEIKMKDYINQTMEAKEIL